MNQSPMTFGPTGFRSSTLALIVASFAVWLFYELPNGDKAIIGRRSTCAMSTLPATSAYLGRCRGSRPCPPCQVNHIVGNLLFLVPFSSTFVELDDAAEGRLGRELT
jgi:hypothetical protein